MTPIHRLALPVLGAVAMALLGGCDSQSYRAYDGPVLAMRSISYQESGTVSEIDQDSGVLTLLGNESTSRLPFDTADMQEIKEGDTITAYITMNKLDADQGRRAYDAPELRQAPPAGFPPDGEALGRRDVIGTIASIDHRDVNVRSGEMSLKLNFASAIDGLKDGDRVQVKTAYTRGN